MFRYHETLLLNQKAGESFMNDTWKRCQLVQLVSKRTVVYFVIKCKFTKEDIENCIAENQKIKEVSLV